MQCLLFISPSFACCSESLIIDLRDAALQLAGLIAAGETASDAAVRCSMSLGAPEATRSSRQQQQQHQQEQRQLADATSASSDSSSQSKQQPQHQQPQQQGPKHAKQGSSNSLSLRRRSSMDSHESLRLRPSPIKADKYSVARSSSASKIPQPPGARSAGSPALTGASKLPPAGAAAAGRASPGLQGGSMRIGTVHQLAHQHGGSEQQRPGSGRYDSHASSHSPSPEPSQTFGASSAHQDAGSRPISPAGSTCSISSPSKVPHGALSPTAKRLLQNAQQQQQQQHQWETDAAGQQHHQQQQGQEEAYVGGAGLPLTEQPSEQWRALQQLGSAQHLLAALEHSPPSASKPAMHSSPNAAAAAARPSLQGRSPGQLVRSPGLVSPCSSPDSPVREGIGVYSTKGRPESWGSRLPSQPSSAQSWQAGHAPLPLQQQQQEQGLWLDDAVAAGAGLAAQESSYLERNNPMQSPADGGLHPEHGRSGSATTGAGWASGTKLTASAPASPMAAAWRVHMAASPAASEPPSVSHSAAAASIGSMVGPCRANTVSRIPQQLSGASAAATAAAAHAVGTAEHEAAFGGPSAQPAEYAHMQAAAGVPQTGSGSPASSLRKSVSWADRVQQQQQQQQAQHDPQQHQQQHQHDAQGQLEALGASPKSMAAALGGQLFAEDAVRGACSMYSPYVPPTRQQAVSMQPDDDMVAAAPIITAAPAPDTAASAASAAAMAAAAVAASRPTPGHRTAVVPGVGSPVPSASPALSTVLEPASDAVAVLELSDLSGLSNQSPSSVQFGGCDATPPHSMNFNVLYSAYAEPRSEHSDTLSGQYSNLTSGVSEEGAPAYETRDMSKARVPSAGRARAAAAGGGGGGSPGAQGEISFALKGGESPGSLASSLGESAPWLTAQMGRHHPAARGVAGMLAMKQAQQLQQQQSHQQQQQGEAQVRSHAQQQQQQREEEERQLLWDLLQAEEDNMQLESLSSGPSADDEAAAPAAATEAAGMQQQQQQQAGYSDPRRTATAPPPQPAASAAGSVAGMGTHRPGVSGQHEQQLPMGMASASAAAAGAAADRQSAAAAGGSAPYCGSSRGSFSSSMDLSPVKRQLFRSVSRSCHSLLQGAAGLSTIAAQLDAAASAAAATDHGSKTAAASARELLMAKQQRLELHQRVQQQGGLSRQLAACPEHQQHEGGVPQGLITLHGSKVSVAARKALSSSAETASSFAASSITPYVNEATAAAEAALAAADAAVQLSTSCPAAFTLASGSVHAYGSSASESGSSRAAARADQALAAAQIAVEAEAAEVAAAAAAAAQQGHGVLMGLTPVVPGAADRPARGEAQQGAYSPAASDPDGSPRAVPAHGTEAVAKALFPSAQTAAAGAAAAQEREAAGSLQQQPLDLPPQAAAVSQPPASPGVQPAAGAAAAASAPASPSPVGHMAAPRAAAAAASSSLPASPAPVGAADIRVSLDLPRSGGLGPRSTAALAELQSQLLTMAVEKAALQRQLQQGRTEVDKLHEKVMQGGDIFTLKVLHHACRCPVHV